MGANCSKNVVAGAACEYLVEQAGGGVAGGTHALLSAGPQAVQFKQQVDQAYAQSCSAFAEKTAPAARFGRGTGALEVMESGVFLSRPLDFQSASQEYCMATGEFSYAVFDLVAAVQKTPQQKAEKLDTSLKRLVAAVKRAGRLADLAIRTGGVAAEGKNTIDRLNDLAHCRR